MKKKNRISWKNVDVNELKEENAVAVFKIRSTKQNLSFVEENGWYQAVIRHARERFGMATAQVRYLTVQRVPHIRQFKMEHNDAEMYRCTSLGTALKETVEELCQLGVLPHQLIRVAMKEFDSAFAETVEDMAQLEAQFKGGKVASYKCIYNSWTVELRQVQICSANRQLDNVVPFDVRIKAVNSNVRMD